MNPELLERFVAAHEKLAEAAHSIAASLHAEEGKTTGLTAAELLIEAVNRTGSAVEELAPVDPTQEG